MPSLPRARAEARYGGIEAGPVNRGSDAHQPQGLHPCGLIRCLLCSLLRALTYALAEATTMSVSAPTPLTILPPFARRTVTSPCDSVPCVTAFTEKSSSSAPLLATRSIALKVRKGPLPAPAETAAADGLGRVADHSTLAPEEMTTFAHFAVSAAMTLPKSCGVPLMGLPPSSAKRASILGSLSARFTSALSFSMISAGVPRGIPIPNHAVAS